MRHIQESGITIKASRETGTLTLFSRRAHLLTTDKVGGVLPAAVVRSTRLCVGATRQYFLQSLHKKGSDRLSPYTILKQKSSPVVRDALRWRQPPI